LEITSNKNTNEDNTHNDGAIDDTTAYHLIDGGQDFLITEQKKFHSQKHEDMKLPAVFQSDEEVDTLFEIDSESDQVPEKKDRYLREICILQNHPLYDTHQVSKNDTEGKELSPGCSVLQRQRISLKNWTSL
jgi:hypothetical protein